MSATRRKNGLPLQWPLVAAGLLLALGCFWYAAFRLVREMDAREGVVLLATGYCNCEECCGWTRDGSGRPVFASGPLKGRPKEIGRTSSGTMAKHGTIAADPARFPTGTRITVPGYGKGTVEDTGGAIKGAHIDLWFPAHEEARRWGARKLRCFVDAESTP